MRARLERQTGANLGAVRLHTDAHADRLAAGHRANAVTIGRDIFFASGRFRPETGPGFGLLVHEVTHVRQHSAGSVPAGPFTAGHRHALEHEARAHERAALLGLPLPALRMASRGDLSIAASGQPHPQPLRGANVGEADIISYEERGDQASRLLSPRRTGVGGEVSPGAPLPLTYAPHPASQPPALRQEIGTAVAPPSAGASPSPAEPITVAPAASAPADPDALAEQVYRRIERRLRLERERGGTGRWR